MTVDGKTRKLLRRFLVIATECPWVRRRRGLPPPQLDRFMVCVKMGYPGIREEMEILRKNENGRTSDAVQQVMTKEELEEAQRETAQIFMHERFSNMLRCSWHRLAREHGNGGDENEPAADGRAFKLAKAGGPGRKRICGSGKCQGSVAGDCTASDPVEYKGKDPRSEKTGRKNYCRKFCPQWNHHN